MPKPRPAWPRRRFATSRPIAGNLCQEPRCWYYRNPDNTFDCLRKGGRWCDALFAENRYHSIFGGMCVSAAPCVAGCPIHNDIPAYMAELRAGKLEEAVAILLRTNPLAAIMGRACAHYCEEECNRFDFDEPVSIRDVERNLGDYALEHAAEFYPAPGSETGKSVAVVGAGPAGLTAAYFLRQGGHAVTVYDRMPEAGGMLTYSIPAYRLPKAVVREQVKALEGMGIRFELGANIGDDGLTLDDLRARYQSVFLATGLWNGKSLRLERGELLDSGLQFLIDVQRGVGEARGRAGAGDRRRQRGRRCGDHRAAVGRAPGVDGLPGEPARRCPPSRRTSSRRTKKGSRSCPRGGRSASWSGTESSPGWSSCAAPSVFDKDGRFAPAFDPAVTTVFEADQVLVAIGQAADLAYAGPALRTERGMIVIDRMTGATSLEGVFAGGDVTGDRATVVQAMAAGQRAAAAIDAYLAGTKLDASPTARGQISLIINASGAARQRTDADAPSARAAAHVARRR